MILTGIVLLILIQIYTLLLIARIVTEMIQAFSRQFQPPRWFIFIAEPIFMVTDPPVKALRKVIPPLQMNNVSLDLSVIVLFVIMMILQFIVRAIFL